MTRNERWQVGYTRQQTEASPALAVVDLFAGLNKLNDGLQVEIDEKPWYG